MLPDPQDTIVALASSTVGAARAIVRVSGPKSREFVRELFSPFESVADTRRSLVEGSLRLSGIAAPLPADLYFWPAPRTYTGQDLIEVHTIACEPLLNLLIAQLLSKGARAAQPGEFTLRAFLSGKLDLPRAEAVLGVINAGSRDELKSALAQLAGGLSQPLQSLRDELLDLLAEVEAALDFAEEEIAETSQKALLDRLTAALARVTVIGKQVERRSLERRPFRVVLSGAPNAGKSSLFNALSGSSAALVSPEPGTTRDYLVRRLVVDGAELELVDTAGSRRAGDTIEEQAQGLGREQIGAADLVIVCREPSTNDSEATSEDSLIIGTKCDLGPPPPGMLPTSAVTGAGLDQLRSILAERARSRPEPALAPSLSRCRAHVQGALESLRRAHAVVLYEDPRELLALELRGALEELGALVGAVYTDDLLDRIFSRFCIGK
jgi:tRNA modification GTPase